MPAWPATLPAPTVRGYALKPKRPVVRTAMEGDPARQRRRFTQTSTTIPVSWKLTEAQMAIFETFHQNELLDGAAWFDDITLINGQGVRLYSARFVAMGEDSYNATLIGNKHWHVTAWPLNA